MRLKITLALMTALLFMSTMSFAQLKILSGPEQGSYYQFGEDIIKATEIGMPSAYVNQMTSGAAYNFNQLADPESPDKVALIQSDYLYYMQAMDAINNTEKTKSLKVILPLASEEIHFVTKAKNELKSLTDLAKKTVAIGTTDQGTYATANIIKDRSQIFWSSRNVHFDNAMNDLYMDKIDAFVIVGSAPLAKLNINPQSQVDELALIELTNFNDWAKYYQNDTIYAGDYKWLEEDVPTFSVRTLLIVNEVKLSEEEKETVMQLKNQILNMYQLMKAEGHPKWKEVNFYNWKEEDWSMFK